MGSPATILEISLYKQLYNVNKRPMKIQVLLRYITLPNDSHVCTDSGALENNPVTFSCALFEKFCYSASCTEYYRLIVYPFCDASGQRTEHSSKRT